jgi:hypothetical protein
MVEQATAVEGVRLPMRDLRSGGKGRSVVREGLRSAEVAGVCRDADGIRQQVFDLVEFFDVVGEPGGQHGQRLRHRAGLPRVEPARPCSLAWSWAGLVP